MKKGLIEEIKERITIPAYMIREHASRIHAGRCKSFRPDSKNASSLMVNERDWYDFGSGMGGDIIDLAAHDKFNGDKGAAIRYLAESWGMKAISEKPEIEIAFRSYLKILDLASEFYHASLEKRHIDYLRGRGLTEATIKELRIGWAANPCDHLKEKGFTQEQIAESGILSFLNRIMVPYLRNGNAVYMIGRASSWEDAPSSNESAKYTKLYRNELSEHPIWGFDTLRREGEVIVAEGIFDAISCYQEGYAVVTAVTGAFSAEQKKDLIPALKGRNVVICMDYDPVTKAGQRFTEALANELFEAGIHVSAAFLCGEERKIDLSELYALNPERATLEKVFSSARRWDSILVERIAEISNENEKRAKITAFLRRCSTCFDWPTVAQMIEDVRDTGAFADTWLKELAKTLRQAPPDDQVVRDFIANNECIFHESLGWYEYGGSVWGRVLETEIRQRISKIFGRHRTANRVGSVYQLTKGEMIYKGTFNTPDFINFQNGMFNIRTGKLMPHSKDYYSAIQLDYAYDEKAAAPTWQTFVTDVTGGDERRIMLIQEMFGYCLTRDVRYQKCFYLIGDGANGKSKLLQILEAMVGSSNTSHIEIAFLGDNFQRIKLLNSMVNICSDMKTDVQGTESYLKAIVSGDPISGCYKGKDFVDFAPFCKMIFSSNAMLHARDVDYGLLRRLCFIKFPIKFVENPSKPNEMKKEPAISESLMRELPGIFNWAYIGLQSLLSNDAFTITTDQTELTRELLVMSNPLISFVEDVVGNGGEYWNRWIPRTEVYERYSKWCRETNTVPMSARTFWPRLRHVITTEEGRSRQDRMVRFLDTK